MKRMLKISLGALLVVIMLTGMSSAQTWTTGDNDGAWLGIFMQSVTRDLAETFNLDSRFGVIVNEVVKDSPADKAGLKEDDIIIAINDEKIRDDDDLTDFLLDAHEGDEVALKVIRDGKEMTINVTLGERENDRNWYRAPRAPRAPKAPRAFNFNFDNNYSTSYLGVSLQELTGQLGEYFGVEYGDGALVTEVDRDSPAEKAGIKAGDVITKIGDDEVKDYDDVIEYVADLDPGDKTTVTVIRDKSEKSFEVEIGEKEDNYSYLFGRAPQVDLNVPDLRNLGRSLNYSLTREQKREMEQEMKQLQHELQKMKEELKEIHKKLD